MTSPKYAVGAAVRIDTRFPTHHCRAPHYCRGKVGVIERICGEFRNPETLAYGEKGVPRQMLYRVRVGMDALWGAGAENAGDATEIEIYEHWLSPA